MLLESYRHAQSGEARADDDDLMVGLPTHDRSDLDTGLPTVHHRCPGTPDNSSRLA